MIMDIEETLKPLIRNCNNNTTIFNTKDWIAKEDVVRLLETLNSLVETKNDIIHRMEAKKLE
jgi:hypothetical protein|tara:strand:+ start:616 stop:801 length:186 start_codon:yes stop_codon:yes gene_type:complete